MNKKMIEQHKKEIEHSIRLYQIGINTAEDVKNKLNCLYVDILLSQQDTIDKSKFEFRKDRNFNVLLEEMI